MRQVWIGMSEVGWQSSLSFVLQDYSRSIELEPVNVSAFHSRGSLYQRLGRWAGCIPRFGESGCRISVNFSPFPPLDAVRQDEALADLTAALRCDPSCASALNARGVLLQVCDSVG